MRYLFTLSSVHPFILSAFLCVSVSPRFVTARALAAPQAARVWPVPDWQTATPESEGMSSEKLEALREYCEQRKTRAALVIRHGRIVGEWYWDGKDNDSLLPVYSITKSVTALAVGLLVQNGKARLDQPAADFIPEWRKDNRKTITIRHLLSMTSGLYNTRSFQRPDELRYALRQPLEHPPGTVWAYNNRACNTLNKVITQASGIEMGAFLQKRLFEPLGIRHVSMDKSLGKTLAYMGMRTTPRELAKIGYLMLNNGAWNKQQILTEGWIHEATSPSQSLNRSYGYLWWLGMGSNNSRLPQGCYRAAGLFGNYLMIFPAQDLIVVRLIGNGRGPHTDGGAFSYAEKALAAMKN